MDDLRTKYERKFNSPQAKVKTNEFWNRYFIKKEDFPYKRILYATKSLYGKILDVGSADGFGAFIMSQNKNIKSIVCLEVQYKAIEKAKRNLQGIKNVVIVKGIAENIPFLDNAFDCLHCGATLEHVFNDKKAISEMARVVKDLAAISVPIGGGTSLEHIREYKKVADFKELVNGYFNIVREKILLKNNGRKVLVLLCKKI